MIHIVSSTKDQTFLLNGSWRLIFANKVPNVEWSTREEAEEQLRRLDLYTDVIEDDFSIGPRRKLK